jgi:hypothetical protein
MNEKQNKNLSLHLILCDLVKIENKIKGVSSLL